MNVRIHIERLILDGLPVSAAQGPMVRAAIESRLEELLAARGLSPIWAQRIAVPSLGEGAAPIHADANPVRTGHLIAGALMNGLGSDNEPFKVNQKINHQKSSEVTL